MKPRTKTLLKSISGWIPTAIVLGLIAYFGNRHKLELRAWVSTIPGVENWLADESESRPAEDGEASRDHDHDGIAYYTCSMHPSVRSSDPGICPICSMDLTPVTDEEAATGTFVVDEGVRQSIGVQTAAATRREISKVIRSVGIARYDETTLSDVTLKFRGWIGEVYADFEGVEIVEGSALFTIYSPEALAAQEELLEAARQWTEGGGETFIAAARRRLLLWGIDEAQIDEIQRDGKPREYLTIKSPANGTVIEKNIVEGSFVGEGTRLYRIVDLSNIWIDVEVYEADQPFLSVGQVAWITLSHQPDASFEGTVDFIYPALEEKTRTLRARMELYNPDRFLTPGLYVNAEIEVPLGESLVVPASAVIYAGKRRVVFLDAGDGKLQPREIQIGARTSEWIVVTEGLAEGDIVVSSGNFLIASESKLKSGGESW